MIGVYPQIILQSSGEYSNQYANEYANPNPLVEPISGGLGYSEKEYSNQYANPNPCPTRLSGGLEYSIPLNTPKIFWEQEKITNLPPVESPPRRRFPAVNIVVSLLPGEKTLKQANGYQ